MDCKEPFGHNFQEEYYGDRCTECGLFYPFGCAPWDEEQEEECCDYCGKPVYDASDYGCEYCDSRVRSGLHLAEGE